MEIKPQLTFTKGDQQAFKELFTRYYRQLVYFVDKMLQDQALAEDIVVETFVALYESDASFESMPQLSAYLYTTAKNRTINYIKYQDRRLTRLQQYLGVMEEHPDYWQQETVEANLLQRIYTAVDCLPPQCKTIFKMLYQQQLSYDEVATALQLTSRTVRNQKARAIALLRKVLVHDSNMVVAMLWTALLQVV